MLMLFLPRSLLLLLLLILLSLLRVEVSLAASPFRNCGVVIAGRGFTRRGEPLVAEKPTPFRNCGVH